MLILLNNGLLLASVFSHHGLLDITQSSAQHAVAVGTGVVLSFDVFGCLSGRDYIIRDTVQCRPIEIEINSSEKPL